MAIKKELLDQLLGGRDPNEVFAKGGLLGQPKSRQFPHRRSGALRQSSEFIGHNEEVTGLG